MEPKSRWARSRRPTVPMASASRAPATWRRRPVKPSQRARGPVAPSAAMRKRPASGPSAESNIQFPCSNRSPWTGQLAFSSAPRAWACWTRKWSKAPRRTIHSGSVVPDPRPADPRRPRCSGRFAPGSRSRGRNRDRTTAPPEATPHRRKPSIGQGRLFHEQH